MSTLSASDPEPKVLVAGREPLPIDSLLPEVLASLDRHPNLIIEASPGAGKTTRVPPAVLSKVDGEVLVLEPRRLAARMAARRVAAEMGEPLGRTVGYRVRSESMSGPQTRLLFMTEGVLTRRLLQDPDLRGAAAVILDEFHERHLDTDLALALLRRLQQRRPELKLIVMSATLDSKPIARLLDGSPVLEAPGRMYPLAITHLPYSPKPLETQVADAVDSLLTEGNAGHVLVFLPGLAEIRRAMHACDPVARRHGLLSLPLHGDLAPEDQDRAVAPSRQPKLIFATNVAESSITVDGITAVIDSGLARVASHSPWTGLATLQVARISKASARQRAGRAGRTAPGKVLRLYPQEDLAQRPDQDIPEILRADLASLALQLRAMGTAFTDLQWLDPAPEQAREQANHLLNRIAAEDGLATRMAQLPAPPRVARMLLEASARGESRRGLLAAALLASGHRPEHLDLLQALERPFPAEVQREVTLLRRALRSASEGETTEDDLLRAILIGYPDRVAKRRSGNQLLLSNGGSAELAGTPPGYGYMVVLDVQDRPERGLPVVRLVSRIEPDWLLDLFPERVQEFVALEWNRTEERVERVTTLRYDELTIAEWRDAHPKGEAVSEMLTAKAIDAGLGRFLDEDVLRNLLQRIAFAGLPVPEVKGALTELCANSSSFAELGKIASQLPSLLEASIDRDRLRSMAPGQVRLGNGREAKVHYDEGKPPWIASRLQDFFGMQQTPRFGPDRVPVVAHLLAPNQRAVQTTNDLAGFWQRLYPQVRRELMRRYPRHAWPEKPV